MATVLLAWEAGENLGHEMQVTAAAVHLKDAGHDPVVVAPHGRAANGAALHAGLRWQQLPPTLIETPPPVLQMPWHSRSTGLWDFGLHSSEFIRERLAAWDRVLHQLSPDVVALQAAPLAQVAVRLVEIRSVEFGIGFDVPPLVAPFPPFKGADQFDPDAALRLEEAMLDRVHRATGVVRRGMNLQQWVSGDTRLVITLPELDHYRGADDPTRQIIGPLPLVSMGTPRLAWGAGKPRVLAYLRAEHLHAAAMFKALAALRGEVVVVCFGADDALAALARSLRLRLHTSAVSLEGLVITADLVVSHGGGGLVATAAAHGARCVVLPTNYEQFLTGSLLASQALGVLLRPQDKDGYGEALMHAQLALRTRGNTNALAMRCRGASARARQALVSAIGDT